MPLRRIVFIVTQDCQLNCSYCYLVGKNQTGKMTWETAKKTVDFLMSLPVTEDRVVFDFIGGEPLLEIGLIHKICRYIVSELNRLNHPWLKDYSFRFTTNGLLYSSSKVQEFISEYKECLQIQLSIDGTKRKHDLNRVFSSGKGSYDKVLPNVRLWIEQFREKARVFMVISHDDLPYLSESVIHHIGLGIKDIFLSFVVEDVWRPGDGKILEEELKIVADHMIDNNLTDSVKVSTFREELGLPEYEEHIYPCGIHTYTFDNKGDIYSCIRFKQFSLRDKPERTIGSIYEGLDTNKLRPFLCFDRESSYTTECLRCEIATCCRWCPAENYDSSDSGTIFQRTTTLCEIHHANTRMKNYYWNRINNTVYER